LERQYSFNKENRELYLEEKNNIKKNCMNKETKPTKPMMEMNKINK
jgi:hypothetical protein